MNITWKLQVKASKNKEKMLDIKASAYEYGDVYRVCFSNYSQIYYFEIINEEGLSEDSIKQKCLEYFTEHRNSLDIAKCPRCFKWHVRTGQFCERCKEAMKQMGNIELELEI
jgi:hypothetical protein